ncbi:MAG: cellulose synthase subunit BcsC-related outer membrane protein [Verrucomicrobiota bacterium]
MKCRETLITAALLVITLPLVQAQMNSVEATPQQNLLPSQEIPTRTFDPAEDANPKKLRSKKLRLLLKEKKYQEFQTEYETNPSADWATALAWTYYNDDHLTEAREWFNKALILQPHQADAIHGLTVLDQRKNHKMVATGPGNAHLLKANKSFQEKNYSEALKELDEAEKKAPLVRGPRMLRAWSTYQLGQNASSALLFEDLYREKPDQESAEGVFLSRRKMGQWHELGEFAMQTGGPLAEIYNQSVPQEYYDRGLFLASEKAAPGKIKTLKNIDSSSLTLGGGFREKSGDLGLSHLTAIYGPLLKTNIIFDGVNELSLEVQRFDLDSGRLSSDALLGSVPLHSRPFLATSETEINNLVIPTLRYRRDGWTSPYAELGTTPLNAPVSPLPTGKLGVTQQTDGGYWQVEGFSKSITESLLSYSGVVDPYTGKSFGRVVETGLHLSAFQDIGNDWGIYGNGTAGWLLGKEVDDNQHVGGSISLSKNLHIENFKYFSIGPVVSADHYEKNLSHFTTGQGGYFSPDYILQGLGALNFLTEEGQQFILRGNLGVGAQVNHQAASDFFPMAPDGRTYAKDTNSSLVFNARLEGVGRVSDHWQIGGEIGYEQSASYQSTVGFIFLRYLFEPRPAVFSTDLAKFSP